MQDVIILCETFVTEPLNISGFYATHALAKQPPKGRPSGGVSCFHKASLGQPRQTHVTEDSVTVHLKDITIIGVYLRPQTTAEETIESITKILAQTDPEKSTIMAGDFNCRLDIPNKKERALMELMEEEGFQLTNSKETPTYIAYNGTSTINLIFYRGENMKQRKHAVLGKDSWDTIRKHLPVTAAFHLQKNLGQEPKETRRWTPRSLDTQVFNRTLDQGKVVKSIEAGELDTAATMLQDCLLQATTAPPPVRKSKPWFDTECYEMRNKVLERLHDQKNQPDQEKREKYNKERRIYVNRLSAKRKNYAQKEEQQLLREAEKQPYKALDARRTTIAPNIPMETWEAYFTENNMTTQKNPRKRKRCQP